MNRDVAVLFAIGVVIVSLGTGCATYTDHVSEAKKDVVAGQPEEAATSLNEALGTEKNSQMPDKLTGENTLMLLERATILQALGEYKLAARDMMVADQQLDWLDIGAQGKAKLGKYMFSGSSVKYRAPPFERLMLNALNCLNFLAIGEAEEAKVEARRFRIIEQFFVEDESKTLLPESLGFGNYLGGLAFEAAGDYNKAVRYYSRAWKNGVRTERFKARLGHLLKITGYDYRDLIESNEKENQASGGSSGGSDGSNTGSSASAAGGGGGGKNKDAMSGPDFAAAATGALDWDKYKKKFVGGEVLVVVQTGLVPYKKGKRLPVGAALEVATNHSYDRYALSSAKINRARSLSSSGSLKWINFPVLTTKGLPGQREVSITVDQSEAPVKLGANVSKQVRHAWNRIKGALMAAAITRMITRAVAGAAAREGASEAAGNSAVGALAQIAVEGGMAAADKPDTRSWSMLPARIRISRLHLEPGQHTIQVNIDGMTLEKSVDVSASGPTVVNFSRIR